MPEPVEDQAGSTGTGSSGAGEAASDHGAPKAERAAAKQARKAAKAAAQAARKAQRAAAKKADKAAKAAADEARATTRASARQDRVAAKAVTKATRKADKASAKQAKGAANAEDVAARSAEKESRRAAKAADEETRRRARAAKAADKAARREAHASLDGSAPGAGLDGQPGAFAASAGAMLEEVAGLVRRTEEPAGARILERAPDGPSAGAAEVEPDRASEPEPALEMEAEQEPESASAPEPAQESEPGLAGDEEHGSEPAIADLGDVTTPEAEPDREPVAINVEPWPADGTTSSWPTAPDIRADPGPGGTDASDAVSQGEPEPVEIPEGAAIQAAIDVGATSVHLLVAAIDAHRVIPLVDESAFLGLGDRVARDGRLGTEARDELVATLATYADRARELGAQDITIVGTEPMRRAFDTAAVATAVEARAGAAFHVLDHDEEGMLMLLGVTLGRPLASTVVVIDVGGGSTEFVAIDPAGHVRSTGLALGAARLTRDLVRTDPPSLDELEALRTRVREVLAGAPDLRPGELVGVGGTVSNLLKLLPTTASDRNLTRRRLTVALAMLTVERSAQAAERHLVRPERARILPAGAIIVDAILERYEADRLRVSDEGIREGLALAVATAGPAWRDRLPLLARGWRESLETAPSST